MADEDEINTALDAALDALNALKPGERQTIMIDGRKGITIEKMKGPMLPDAIPFKRAALKIEQRLSVSIGGSYTILRGLCASGEVRSVGFEVGPEVGRPLEVGPEVGRVRLRQLVPRTVRPSEWGQVEVDLEDPRVMVSHGDLDHWLDRQGQPAKSPVKPKAVTQRGKGPRISAILQKMYPEGVPEPGLCVRKDLANKLVKADPSLGSLDPKTLKTAIEKYNASIGNDRK